MGCWKYRWTLGSFSRIIGKCMYKQLKNIDNTISNLTILRLFDNAIIPFDPDNTDYQAYLKWLEEGNEPLPADE